RMALLKWFCERGYKRESRQRYLKFKHFDKFPLLPGEGEGEGMSIDASVSFAPLILAFSRREKGLVNLL
ncbi:MAG: hypothetical protein ACREWG_12690, partial [Gammaproteobacteria bacterium]